MAADFSNREGVTWAEMHVAFRANPIPSLTHEQVETARRKWMKFYGFDDKPDAWWFA